MNFKSHILLLVLWIVFTSVHGQVEFENIASGSNITHHDSAMGRAGGVSFYDFNNDGLDDLTIATGIGDSILFYVSDGCKFNKIPSLVDNLSDVMQVLWADIDNDGDKDLVATSYRFGARLYENKGNLNLQDISINAGIDTSHTFSYGANFADYNKDGYLDLLINNYIFGDTISNVLYKNNGNLTFTDVTKAAGLWDTNTFSFVSGFFDYDKDGWIDLYTTTDKQTFPNQLYKNNANGTFTNTSVSSNTHVYMDAMSATVDDYDNDGWLDFFVTNTQGMGNVLLHNDGNGSFTDTASGSGVVMNSWCWGAAFFDVENDMDLDLYVNSEINWGSMQRSTLFENDGSGQFLKINVPGMSSLTARSYSNSIGDYNNDGLMDIAVINGREAPYIWENKTQNAGNYLKFELEGSVSNRDAIGAFIYTYVGLRQQLRYLSSGESFIGQFSQYETVGIGSNSYADSVVVVWPSGLESRLYDVPANQHIKIFEGSINPRLSIAIIGGQTICEGDKVEIVSLNSFDNYQWNTGDTTSFIFTDSIGTYSLLASNNLGPSASFQTAVDVKEVPSFNLGKDTALCGSSKFSLHLPTATSACYEWSNGSLDSTLNITKSGIYYLKARLNGCLFIDSIDITLEASAPINLGEDTVICSGDSMVLDAGANWVSYYWSDNSTGQKLSVFQSGTYFVEATDSKGCLSSDEINVVVSPCLSIDEYGSNEGVEILPNPTHSSARIRLKNNNELIENLRVYSIDGAQNHMAENVGSNDYVLNVSAYQKGLYFIHIQTKTGLFKGILMVN